MADQKVVAIDIDNTTVEGAIVTKYARPVATATWSSPKGRRPLVTPPFVYHAAVAVYLEHRYGHSPRTIARATKMIESLVAGKPVDVFTLLVDDNFDRYVAPYIYPGALDAIARNQDAGNHVAYTSATAKPMAEALGRKTAVEHIVASYAAIRDGKFTSDITVAMGPQKVEELKLHMAEHDLEGAVVDAWTDSPTDQDLIDFAHQTGGEVHLVNPMDVGAFTSEYAQTNTPFIIENFATRKSARKPRRQTYANDGIGLDLDCLERRMASADIRQLA